MMCPHCGIERELPSYEDCPAKTGECMKRYRICFGLSGNHPKHVTVDVYVRWLSTVLEGFAVYRPQGWWHGKPEEAVTIEYVGHWSMEPTLRDAAKYARRFSSQESVLFTVEDVQAEFIKRE